MTGGVTAGSEMEVRLFGPMAVRDAQGRPVDLGTPKQRAVLAMLAVDPGRVASVDRLVDELWNGEAPSSAAGTLQAYVSNLRKAIEPDRAPRSRPRVLLTRDPGYVLDVAPGAVDIVRFDRWIADGCAAVERGDHRRAIDALDRALALWRDDPLVEFTGQAFATATVARLGELRVAGEEARAEARLALDEIGTSVADLERLVDEHPYREQLWGLLARTLYRSGRAADALAALRRARDILAVDLGLDPGPELRRLEQAVLDHDSELAPGSAATSGQRTTGPIEDRSAVVGGDRLIGRERELERLGARLADLRQRRGGVLLVEGEAGIGKTRLARAAADEALAQGLTVAWGRGVDTATTPAFWPWQQVMAEIASSRPDVGAARVVEEAVDVLGGSPRCASMELFDLYRMVLAALTAVAPAVVVLDDLHWLDAASLRLLAFAAGDLGRGRVLVVATMRTESADQSEALRDLLGALAREEGSERFAVEPLTGADVASYVRMRGGDPALADVLHDRSGGNPFYLGELLRLPDRERTLASAVPVGVSDVVRRRVARLPEASRSMLVAAAAAGRDVDVDLLEAATGVAVEDVVARLEPAVATGLLTEAGEHYVFAHALVRDTLYAGLGRVDAARWHLRIGTALERRADVTAPGWDPRGSSRSVEIAHHFARATRVGGRDRAVHYASRAAREAALALAYDDAVTLWELALTVVAPDDGATRCSVLTELGRARRTVGDADGARRDLEQAVDLAVHLGDRDALVAAVSVFGGPSVWVWRPYGEVDPRMVAILDDLLSGPLEDRHRAALLGTLGTELIYGPRRPEGERLAAEGVELARKVGDLELLATTLNNYYLAAWVPGSVTRRRAVAEEMLALPGLPRVTELVARVLRTACLARAGEIEAWDRDLARCDELLAEIGRPELEAMVRIPQIARRTLAGDWAAADALVADYARLRYGSSLWGPDFPRLVTAFTSMRGQGRVPEILDDLVSHAARPGMDPLRPLAILAALDCGKPDRASELIRRWGTDVREDWVGDFLTAIWGMVAARLGTPDPESMYVRLVPYADQLMMNGMTSGWGSHHIVLAELADRLGRRDAALGHARRAVEVHRRLGLDHWEEQSLALLDRLTTAPLTPR